MLHSRGGEVTLGGGACSQSAPFRDRGGFWGTLVGGKNLPFRSGGGSRGGEAHPISKASGTSISCHRRVRIREGPWSRAASRSMIRNRNRKVCSQVIYYTSLATFGRAAAEETLPLRRSSAPFRNRGRGGGCGRRTLPWRLQRAPFRPRWTLPSKAHQALFRERYHPPLTPPSVSTHLVLCPAGQPALVFLLS